MSFLPLLILCWCVTLFSSPLGEQRGVKQGGGQEGEQEKGVALALRPPVGGKENIPGMYLQHRGTYVTSSVTHTHSHNTHWINWQARRPHADETQRLHVGSHTHTTSARRQQDQQAAWCNCPTQGSSQTTQKIQLCSCFEKKKGKTAGGFSMFNSLLQPKCFQKIRASLNVTPRGERKTLFKTDKRDLSVTFALDRGKK